MYPPPQQFTPVYAAPIHHQQHHSPVNSQQQSVSPQPFISPSVTQHSQADFPQLDSGLVVPTFQQGEDLIECINKAILFVVASSFADTGNKGIATTSRGNYATGPPRVVKCYNCQGEGHMARQCTQPKRLRNVVWFKELMLAEALEEGQILDEEQLTFLSDPGISEAPFAQQKIPKNLSFQTKDLDAYDSDCDDLSSAKAVLMANLSSCDSDVLSEVPYFDSSPNDMINQDVQEMQYSEQTHIDDFQDNEIHSDSNIILYSQYLQESQDAVIQDTNSSTPNDLLVLSLVEQITDHLNKIKEDFGKRFVTKKELSAEQAFWLKHSSFSETPVTSHTPVRIEAPSELPKVSFVNESLKKLKYQLDNFDKVVKKRTTSDAITADAWGFEHTKACFVTEIIPFLKDTFNAFDKTLLDEITEVQTVFNQMKAAVDQCSVDKNAFEIQIKQLSIDNDQLLKQIIKCLELKTELLKKKDLIEKDVYDKLLKSYSTLEKHFIRKLKDRIKSLSGKDSVENVKKDIDEIETINIELEHNLNAQLQEKVIAIAALKNELRKLKGKNIVDTAVLKPSAIIAAGMFKLDIERISHRLKNNRDAHEVYIKKTIENTDTLRGFVKRARTHNPSEPLLESACMFTKHVQELLVYVSKTCPSLTKPSEKLVAVTPMNKDKKVSASGSKPSGSTKNNRITRPPSSNQKNKVEEHPRKVKSSLNKLNSISKANSNALVKHSVRNAKFESICAIYNKCLFDANHDMCIIDYVNDVNVFIEIGYSLKPTGRTFTIVGNKCPLTRFTSTKVVPTKETTNKSVATPTQGILVYSRRPKTIRSIGSSSKVKIVESKTSNSKEPKQYWGSTVSDVPSSSLNDCTVRFGNDHIAKIMGYGDYQMGNVTISHVYYVEGLGHNLFSVVQFCDSDLEVAFRKHTCFIRDLDGVDLLKGIRRITCALGKSKKHSHKPKAEDSIKEKIHLLHMDLCGPMRVQSINGRKYILVIVDNFSRFTWVKFLRSKDEVPKFIIKFLKMIQVRLNATVRNIRTDNGIKFVNQTLRAYYEEVRILHQTSVARPPQPNGVVERQNHTLVGAARTMLIFSKAPLFLWTEANATACYTQNRSLIRKHHNKTPYELLHDRKTNLSYLHVFGGLCYPTNDGEDLGKLKPKADI
ncbi:retrovirus-related pol polyprotein from transposon TNT 1-94 [Tanacetum coccineum]